MKTYLVTDSAGVPRSVVGYSPRDAAKFAFHRPVVQLHLLADSDVIEVLDSYNHLLGQLVEL